MFDRSVMAFLALTAIIFIMAIGIGTLDLFNTEQVGLNIVVLGGIGTAGAFQTLGVVTLVNHEDDRDYFFALLLCVGFAAIVGAVVYGNASTSLSPEIAALGWGAYAAGIISSMLSGAVYYLVDDVVKTNHRQGDVKLHRAA